MSPRKRQKVKTATTGEKSQARTDRPGSDTTGVSDHRTEETTEAEEIEVLETQSEGTHSGMAGDDTD